MLKGKGIDISEINTRPHASGIDFYGDSLFTTAPMARENPTLVRRFTEASLKGWQCAMENSLEIADRISREMPRRRGLKDVTGFNRFQIEGVKKLTHSQLIEFGNMNPSRWLSMHDHLKDFGIVDGDLEIEDFLFDPESINAGEIEARNRILSIIIPLLFFLVIVF